MAWSREAVESVKQGANIVQIIGETVALTPTGANFKGLCPFHSEKTPSFIVNPQRGMYHCFGCNTGGSVIDFVMAHENLTFPEAVSMLARRLNINLGGESSPNPRDRALELLEEAKRYYHQILMTKPEAESARMYLLQRGFDEDSWRAFGLGFAPEGWQGLIDHATAQGYTMEDLLAAGLAKKSESGRSYDFLRKRVVFPINGLRDGCIGFGGRTIDPLDQPKYLNSPETRHYQKSQVLFGLAESRVALRKDRTALLVEGYLDVLRLHINGFATAVAPCGTSLTPQHIDLLERHADQVILLFDGDEAGSKAALRAAPLFFNRGLEALVVALPEGMDPDDYIREKGGEAFAGLLETAMPILEYLVVHTLRGNGNSMAGKERTLQILLPLLTELRTGTARDVAIRYMADLIEVKPEHISRLIHPKSAPEQATDNEFSLTARENRHQKMFLKIILKEPELLANARKWIKPEEFDDADSQGLYQKFLALSDDEFTQCDPKGLGEIFPEQASFIRSLLLDSSLGWQALENCEVNLRYETARIKESNKNHLFHELKQAEGTPGEELALRRYIKVRDELRAMKSVPGARSLNYAGSGTAESESFPQISISS